MDPSCFLVAIFLKYKAGRWIRRLGERGRPQQNAKRGGDGRSSEPPVAEWRSYWRVQCSRRGRCGGAPGEATPRT